jgi:hypothetical protein
MGGGGGCDGIMVVCVKHCVKVVDRFRNYKKSLYFVRTKAIISKVLIEDNTGLESYTVPGIV